MGVHRRRNVSTNKRGKKGTAKDREAKNILLRHLVNGVERFEPNQELKRIICIKARYEENSVAFFERCKKILTSNGCDLGSFYWACLINRAQQEIKTGGKHHYEF